MDKEKVIEFLKSKNVNPMIILNPSSNLVSDIVQYALTWRNKCGYAINDESKDNYYLESTIRVDEKGNVTFFENTSVQDKPKVYSRTIKTYSVTEDDKYIEESHVKDSDVEYNLTLKEMREGKVPTFEVHVSMLQKIYDTNGIEWERNHNNFVLPGQTLEDAISLVENEKYMTQREYEKETFNCICEKVTRNYELGSARISQTSTYRNIPNFVIVSKLKGEFIQTLEIEIDSVNELEKIYDIYENNQDITNMLLKNKKLRFDYSKLSKEEREQYFSSIYKSIMSLRNSEIRTAMLTLFLERNFAKELGVESKLSECKKK